MADNGRQFHGDSLSVFAAKGNSAGTHRFQKSASQFLSRQHYLSLNVSDRPPLMGLYLLPVQVL